ncbi:MAG: FAD-dependent oxidoreductase [Pseudomonadota bacterium]
MTFVITDACCNDGACAVHCPVQCIRPRRGEAGHATAEQLYIDPATCIECSVCRDVCPVGAVYADVDLPEHLTDYARINAEHFEEWPIVDWSESPDRRRVLPADRPHLRVAVVGSGPAGCYAVQALASVPGVQVTLIERLPTPFGLVRTGVAPDHPQTKRVVDQFHQVLAGESVRCRFNVELGRDVLIEDLLDHHHAVIYAGGAEVDRPLDIPGADLPGSYAARDFVAWYNGHPDFSDRTFDLASSTAVVIGNGNVALDAARVLARAPATLRDTDMADHAIDRLAQSGIRDVHVVARRGPESGAYTLSELLSLSRMDGVDLITQPHEAVLQEQVMTALVGTGVSKSLMRKLQIVAAASGRRAASDRRRIFLRFLLSPVSINGEHCVESVTFSRNALTVVDGRLQMHATGELETFQTGLVLRAIGSRGRSVPGLPLDDASGTIPNRLGRVTDSKSGAPLPGLYCVGWIKRGATGVIGTNRQCADETVDSLLEDFHSGRLAAPRFESSGFDRLIATRQPHVVDYGGWLRIDALERARAKGKRPRSKITDIGEMIRAAGA